MSPDLALLCNGSDVRAGSSVRFLCFWVGNCDRHLLPMIVNLPTVVDSAVLIQIKPLERGLRSLLFLCRSVMCLLWQLRTKWIAAHLAAMMVHPTDERSGNLVELDSLFLLVCVRRSYRLDWTRYGRRRARRRSNTSCDFFKSHGRGCKILLTFILVLHATARANAHTCAQWVISCWKWNKLDTLVDVM